MKTIRETKAQERERLKQWAKEVFSEDRHRPLATKVPNDSAQKIAGVKVSETAYQLHRLLIGRPDLWATAEAELTRELNRFRFSDNKLAVEDIEAAIAELSEAGLLEIGPPSTRPLQWLEVRNEQRSFNPDTKLYELSFL